MLTVLRTIGRGSLRPRATKAFSRAADGSLVKTDYGRAKSFFAASVPLASFDDLAAELARLERDPYALVIRGEPAPGVELSRPVYRRGPDPDEDGRTWFVEVPRRWAMLDFDGIACPVDLKTDPEAGVRHVLDQLPDYVRRASVYWQLSASAGLESGVIRAHLWYWLGSPADCATLKAWAATLPLRVDLAIFRTVQAHYTAAPVFDGVADWLPRRSGVIRGECDALSLPPVEVIASAPTTQSTDLPIAASVDEALALLGDGEGLAGFNRPIWLAVRAAVVQRGNRLDRESLKAAIRAAIDDAPKDRGRDVRKYKASRYLDGEIARAMRKLCPTVEPHHRSRAVPVPQAEAMMRDAVASWFAAARRKAEALRDFEQRAATEIARPMLPPTASERRKIRKALRAETREQCGEAFSPGPLLQIRAPAGIGKTHAVAEQCRALSPRVLVDEADEPKSADELFSRAPSLPVPPTVWLLEPTLAMAEQAAKMIGPQAIVVRGRLADDEDGEPMCKRPGFVEAVQRAGLPVQANACRNTATGQSCPHFDECRYQRQARELKRSRGGIYVGAHEHLTVRSPAPRPDLVIVDEAAWSKLVGSRRIDLGAINARRPGNGDAAAFDRTMTAIRDALASEPARILAALRARGVNAAKLSAALTYLSGVEERTAAAINPGLSASRAAELLRDVKAPDVPKLRKLLYALRVEIDKPRAEAIGVEVRGREAIVHYRKRREVSKRLPILLLDASADVEINRRIWGAQLQSVEIDVERQATVTQVVDRSFSRQAITGAFAGKEDARNPQQVERARQAAAALRGKIGSIVRRLPAPALVASAKQVRDVLAPALPAGVVQGHFNDLRGRNDFANCAAAVIVGREQPPPREVEALARALFADDAEPLRTATRYVEQVRGLRLRGGSVPVRVQVHPDPRAQQVLEQIREREIEQAIDRLRLVHASTPRPIVLLMQLALDVTVDGVANFDELAAGGSRVERAAKFGVIAIGSENAAALFPDLWPSRYAARDDDQLRQIATEVRTAIGPENAAMLQQEQDPPFRAKCTRYISIAKRPEGGAFSSCNMLRTGAQLVKYARGGRPALALVDWTIDDPRARLDLIAGPVDHFELVATIVPPDLAELLA